VFEKILILIDVDPTNPFRFNRMRGCSPCCLLFLTSNPLPESIGSSERLKQIHETVYSFKFVKYVIQWRFFPLVEFNSWSNVLYKFEVRDGILSCPLSEEFSCVVGPIWGIIRFSRGWMTGKPFVMKLSGMCCPFISETPPRKYIKTKTKICSRMSHREV
jgi:hypothetical protein